MKREIIVETDDDFEGCNDCINCDDTDEICKMRGCIHAIATGDIRECYHPKKYLISKLELNASIESIAKLKKIEKIINTPFCEVEESEE